MQSERLHTKTLQQRMSAPGALQVGTLMERMSRMEGRAAWLAAACGLLSIWLYPTCLPGGLAKLYEWN